MVEASKNVNLGNDELVITQHRQRSSNKFLFGIFLCVLIFVVVLVLILVVRWKR